MSISAPTRDPLVDEGVEFNRLVSAMPAHRVTVWSDGCWVCRRAHVFWWADATALWQTDRIESLPTVIDTVALHVGPAVQLARIGPVSTAQAGAYTGYSCRVCGAVQGDFHVHERMAAALFSGHAMRISVPM